MVANTLLNHNETFVKYYMNCNEDHHNKKYTRRDFLTRTSLGMGALTLGGLLGSSCFRERSNFKWFTAMDRESSLRTKSKRVIYLFQSGAPSP